MNPGTHCVWFAIHSKWPETGLTTPLFVHIADQGSLTAAARSRDSSLPAVARTKAFIDFIKLKLSGLKGI